MEHTREFYIEEFRKAAERHEYFLYRKKAEEMTLEELKDAYMTMQNYLSDMRVYGSLY